MQDVASTYANITLPPPTLNITAYSLPPRFIAAHDWKNAVRDSSSIFSHPERMAWVQNDRIYNTTDIKNLGQCQPTKVSPNHPIPPASWFLTLNSLDLQLGLLLHPNHPPNPPPPNLVHRHIHHVSLLPHHAQKARPLQI